MPVTMTVEAQDQGIASGVLESVGDEKIVLKVPGTSYQLHFTPAVPASDIDAPVGKRFKVGQLVNCYVQSGTRFRPV